MATKRIADVPCWERRWVTKEEAIGLLNLTKPEWEMFFANKVCLYPGKNYDMEELHRRMEKAVQIKPI